MKRLNRLAAAAAGLSLISLVGCGFLADPESRLKTAQVKVTAGDYNGAAREVEAILRRDPKNTKALIMLARLDLKLGAAAAAQIDVKRALNSGATPADLRELSGDILLARGDYAALLKFTSDAESAGNLHTFALRSAAQIELQDFAAAELTLAKARAQSADDPEVLLSMARLQFAQGNAVAALSTLEHVAQRNPNLMSAWILRGRILMSLNKFAGAGDAFVRVTAAAPGLTSVVETIQALAGQAEAQLAQNELTSASQTIKRLAARYPNATPVHYLLGRLALQKGDGQSAVAEFTTLMNADPDNLAIKSLLGAALMMQGSREQSMAILNEVVSRNPSDQKTRQLLAQVLLMADRPDEARRILTGAAGAAPADAQGEWLMAVSLLRLGDMKNGLPLLEKTAAAAPANDSVQLELARAYLADAQYEKARMLLDRIPEGKSAAGLQPFRVMARIGGKNRPDVMRELEELVKNNSSDADVMVIAGAFALNYSDTTNAGRYFSQALQVAPESIGARLGLASVAARSGDIKVATERLNEVLQRDDKQTRAMMALAGLALRNRNDSEATRWLEKAIAADPAGVEARLSLAQIGFRTGKVARANALLDQAVAVAQEKAAAINAVGEILLGAGQNAAARQRFEDAVKLGNRDAALNLARAQLALRRNEDARQTLEAIEGQPYIGRASLMLIELDARSGRYDRARQRIQELRRTGFSGARATELEGDVSLVANQPSLAMRLYGQAFDMAPSSGVAIKLFRLQQSQRIERPDQSLLRWLQRNPTDSSVRLLLATHLLETGRQQGAIIEYEALVRAAPTPDPIILNNLACAYRDVGDDRALDTARRAFDMDSKSSDIADTYGWLLVETGDVARGKAILKDAVETDRSNLTARFHLLSALARSGDTRAAMDGLNELLGSNHAFDERQAAQRLRDSLRTQQRKSGT